MDDIIFTNEDINLFAKASHDFNPLHCNYGYARKTLYGEQVVHGVLGLFACLKKSLEINKDLIITKLEAKYFKPIFCNVSYNIVVNKSTDLSSEIILVDGDTKLLRLKIVFEKYKKTGRSKLSPLPLVQCSVIQKACNINIEDIKEGRIIKGEYTVEENETILLLKNYSLYHSPFENIAILLMWSSYYIGMVMPGQQALYSEIALEIDQYTTSNIPIKYVAQNEKLDTRFNVLNIQFECNDIAGLKIAHGTLISFIRPQINYNISNQLNILTNYKGQLQGKMALITGASRGLGAIMAQILASMSCHVIINFQNSLEDALNLQEIIKNKGGTVELWQGDISDFEWINSKKEELITRGNCLDILICNACQTPKILPFELNAISRINEYIHNNIDITSIPLSLFTPMLNKKNGYGIIISSEYVINSKKEFPHYIAVKAAIEALVSSIAIKYTKTNWFIVRPPKLLTDMSNSPLGNYDCSDPFLIAKNICEHIFVNEKTDRTKNIEIFMPTI